MKRQNLSIMIRFLAPNWLLSRLRIASGHLWLAVFLVALGPSLGNEQVENYVVAPHAATSVTASFKGGFNRADRARTLSVTRPLDPTRGNCSLRWGTPISLVGHTLSAELLAPLRC
jgi:hypothetical protein